MKGSVILRPLASAAVLALVALGLQPAIAAIPHAGRSSHATHQALSTQVRPRGTLVALHRARVAPQARSMPAGLRGTLVALHRAQRTGVLAVANGSLFPLRFTSVAQERRLRVGSRLVVSADPRHHVRLLVRALRTEGVSTRAHVRGIVARRLGRGAVEVLGVNGAAVVIHLGHARVTRVHHTPALFTPTLASADNGPAISPGEEIDTAVTLTGAGAMATGTATIAASSPAQVEVEGLITAVGPSAGTLTIQDEDGLTSVVSVRAAGTITIQDDDGPTTVVALSAAAGSYRVGQEVEVSGIATSAGSTGATVQAQSIRLKSADGGDGGDGGDSGHGDGGDGG